MKLNRLLRVFALVALVGGLAATAGSCSKDDAETDGKKTIGQIVGVVTDDEGALLEGVTVTDAEQTISATSTADGSYTIDNAAIGTHVLTFTKGNYQTTSITLTAAKFNESGVATVNAEMLYAAAKIKGTLLDAKNNNAPLAGVKVSISDSQSTTSAANGTYEIGNLPLDSYTVTFTLEGYATITKRIGRDFFEDNVAEINLSMGNREVLRGKTADDLKEADKWYYNEYRGGGNAESYPHWDWSTDYMASLDFVGAWQEQNEGTTLQIRNTGDEQKNPAELNIFDSYVYGSKLITEDNKIMTIQVRTHSASADAPAVFGVQVVDLSAAEPEAVKIGDNQSYASEDYKAFSFDLSDYVGKEVVLAIGTYRAKSGDYWKQLVLRRIAFSTSAINGWNYLSGTAISEELADWKLTREMVRSTMPQTKKSFTGITVCEGNHDKDNRQACFVSWRANSHIAAEWSFVPRMKDPEIFPGEGYLMKTRGGADANLTEPEAYLYAKFSIAAGCNKLALKTRTFSGSVHTFFKLTAIDNDCNVTHLSPESNTATSAEAADNGCWKFIHNAGDAGTPNGYATFNYDLSQFDGKDVLLVLGVYKGEKNGDENKFVIYNLNLN